MPLEDQGHGRIDDPDRRLHQPLLIAPEKGAHEREHKQRDQVPVSACPLRCLSRPHSQQRHDGHPGVNQQPRPGPDLEGLPTRVDKRLDKMRPLLLGHQQPRQREQHDDWEKRRDQASAVLPDSTALPQPDKRHGHHQDRRLTRQYSDREHSAERSIAPSPQKQQPHADPELGDQVAELVHIEHIEPEQVGVQREQHDGHARRRVAASVGAAHGPHQGNESERSDPGPRRERRRYVEREQPREPRAEPPKHVGLGNLEGEPRRRLRHRAVVLDAGLREHDRVEGAVEPHKNAGRGESEQERAR